MRKHFNSLFDIFDFVLRKTQGSFSGRLLFAMIYQLFTSNPLRLYGGYNKPVNVATKHLFCSCNDSGKDHQSCFPCAAAPINFVHLLSHITFFFYDILDFFRNVISIDRNLKDDMVLNMIRLFCILKLKF